MITKTFLDEQKDLLRSFLDIHCFNAWKILPSQRKTSYVNSLEMMVSPVCNTACTYCYMKNYSDKLYSCKYDRNTLLLNCEKVMKWLVSEKYYPSNIEIFSGEFFNLPFWKEYLDIIFKYLDKLEEGQSIPLVIPTNGTFFFSEAKTQEIQEYLDFVESKNYKIFLSISVDGKYLDNDTRPLKTGKQYNDDFYNRMFSFGAKNKLSYHPMIGAKGIENWIKNFDWYIDNIQKYYNLSTKQDAFYYIYLLEVRNPDWKTSELEKLREFLNHIIDLLFSDCKDNETKTKKLINNPLNIFSSVISSVGRGLGCSLQQCFDIRMGDLALVACHRTAYEELIAAYLDFSEKDELRFKKVNNVNSYIMSNSFNFQYSTTCNNCPINRLCSGPCLGCNYEINKDCFTMVPTVCDLEYVKILSIISKLEEEDPAILDSTIKYINANSIKSIQIQKIRDFIKINKENENK